MVSRSGWAHSVGPQRKFGYVSRDSKSLEGDEWDYRWIKGLLAWTRNGIWHLGSPSHDQIVHQVLQQQECKAAIKQRESTGLSEHTLQAAKIPYGIYSDISLEDTNSDTHIQNSLRMQVTNIGIYGRFLYINSRTFKFNLH